MLSKLGWTEDLEEGASEVARVECVDNWVAAGVEVAEPSENRKDDVVAASGKLCFKYAGHHIERKKGHPANDKHAHDNTQGLCRFLLAREVAELVSCAREP